MHHKVPELKSHILKHLFEIMITGYMTLLIVCIAWKLIAKYRLYLMRVCLWIFLFIILAYQKCLYITMPHSCIENVAAKDKHKTFSRPKAELENNLM